LLKKRLQSEEKDTKTDGDETMVKNGVTISKFSFEALGLGPDVNEHIKSKHMLDLCNGLVMIRYFQQEMDHRKF
jgi:hypothetical protein